MPRSLRPIIDLDAELHALERQHLGLIHQRRMEHLGSQLDAGPSLAVRECRSGFCGDRMTLWLDNGAIMKLKLFWPQRIPLAALCSVRWRDAVGWIIRARTTAGDDVTCYGWRASLTGFNAVTSN